MENRKRKSQKYKYSIVLRITDNGKLVRCYSNEKNIKTNSTMLKVMMIVNNETKEILYCLQTFKEKTFLGKHKKGRKKYKQIIKNGESYI